MEVGGRQGKQPAPPAARKQLARLVLLTCFLFASHRSVVGGFVCRILLLVVDKEENHQKEKRGSVKTRGQQNQQKHHFHP